MLMVVLMVYHNYGDGDVDIHIDSGVDEDYS